MTELNMLYGDNNDMGDNDIFKKDEVKEKPNIYSVARNDNTTISSGQAIHNMASQQIQEPIQQPVYVPQKPTQQPIRRRNEYEYSFWDRMNMKRDEVIKLALFGLVIVFAIALDRVGTFYVSKYIDDNVLTDMQEFLMRLSYPIIVFLILWIAKAL